MGDHFPSTNCSKIVFWGWLPAHRGVFTQRTPVAGEGGAAGPRNSGDFAHGAAFVAGDWDGVIWHEGQGLVAFCSAAAFSLSQIFAKPRILNPSSLKHKKMSVFVKKLGDKCRHKVGMEAGWKED